jgi:hypothetical protein
VVDEVDVDRPAVYGRERRYSVTAAEQPDPQSAVDADIFTEVVSQRDFEIFTRVLRSMKDGVDVVQHPQDSSASVIRKIEFGSGGQTFFFVRQDAPQRRRLPRRARVGWKRRADDAATRTGRDGTRLRVPQPTDAARVKTLPSEATTTQIIDSLGPWVRTADVQKRFNVTRQALLKQRQARKLLGVKLGPRDEMFYPVQQFDENGDVIPTLKPVLDELAGIDPLTIATMLASPAYTDSARTVWDIMRDGSMEAVLEWAQRTQANRNLT